MYLNKKILSIIPARGGSKGIKLKNLKKIKNKSLTELSTNFINELNLVDFKIVSSDHKEILNLAAKQKHFPLKRPISLSGDKISDYQVIKHSLKFAEKKYKYFFDYILYLQPTSPIRSKKDIINALKKIINCDADAIWSVSECDIKFHPKKIFNIQNEYLKLYDKSGKKIIARQQLDKIYIRNGCFYIFNRHSFIKSSNIYLKKTIPYIIQHDIINIDTLEDLKKAKKIIK